MANAAEQMTVPRILLAFILTAVALTVRWFRHIASGAKGYSRERRPRSIQDYHLPH